MISRALKQPSADLSDVAAKARLALEDFERFHAQAHHHMDDGDRLVIVVLREIIRVEAIFHGRANS